ncbi:hypothetical protein E4U52_002026 [Claviceps spartinae]|nr:hypothetical protein E4U52_002026 [Claviceps spartinae]
MAYEFLGLLQQRDRSLYADLDSGLGHNPSALPTHLSRVLYVPEHSTLNLPLYDAQEPYKQAMYVSPFGSEHLVGKPLIGSRLFKTRVNTMDREKVMQSGAPRYVVDLDGDRIKDGVDICATMRAHASVSDGVDSATKINIKVPMSTDGFSLTIENSKETENQTRHIAISATYPLQSVHSKAGIIPTITPAEETSHRLGSILMQRPIAIYDHLGHENSLFRPEMPALLEVVTVASLLVLLWKIRDTAREGLEKEPRPKKALVG